MTGTLGLFTDAPDALPVFNPLSYDGGRCQSCQEMPFTVYLSCYSRSGAHLPNRFVCAACLPTAINEARGVGRVDRFKVAQP